jgi:hypothetical protein
MIQNFIPRTLNFKPQPLRFGTLNVQASSLTDVALSAISRHCIALEALGLAGASITDAGLGRLLAALGPSNRGGDDPRRDGATTTDAAGDATATGCARGVVQRVTKKKSAKGVKEKMDVTNDADGAASSNNHSPHPRLLGKPWTLNPNSGTPLHEL